MHMHVKGMLALFRDIGRGRGVGLTGELKPEADSKAELEASTQGTRDLFSLHLMRNIGFKAGYSMHRCIFLTVGSSL